MHEDSTGTHEASTVREGRVKRLRFRAWRRGFREADLVMGRFADEHGMALDDADLARFEALLEESDADVYAWIVGREPPPPRHDHALLGRMRDFAGTLHDLGLEPQSPESGS
jgi:antitoxin CptB